MKQVFSALLMCFLAASGMAEAQETSTESARPNGVPIERVIAAVAKKTGKKYIVDARVHGQVEIIGQDISAITYSDLLSILQVSGYTAVEGSNYVSVVPESIVRQMPLPIATGKEKFPEAQYVTRVIPVRNISAATLVPILRPMMPTHGHLAAVVCGNNGLLIVDSFANVERIEKLIASLDVGTPFVAHSCEGEARSSSP